jgi:ABC-type cobalamin/Fe3+-siderophores transport system ATPase subunit
VNIDITLKNYRCFREVEWRLTPGLHAFVGLNNVGKSALTRLLYDLRLTLKSAVPALQRHPLATVGHKQHVSSQLTAPVGQTTAIDIIGESDIEPCSITFQQSGEPTGLRFTFSKPDGSAMMELVGNPSADVRARPAEDKAHIANLISELTTTIYIPASRTTAAGHSSGQEWFDAQIGNLLVNWLQQQKMEGDRATAEQFLRLEKAVARLIGAKTLSLRPITNRSMIDIEIDGRVRRLDEVGTGISHLITTAAIVAFRRPSYLFIDEPEINLHAALQEQFLSLLAPFCKSGVVFSTHSLGLARSVTQSTWQVYRGTDGFSELQKLAAPDTPIAGLCDLQYSAWRAAGMQMVLAVEGPNDVLIIRHWLRTLDADRQILVAPLLNGDGMATRGVHQCLSDLRLFPTPIAALADSERKRHGGPTADTRGELAKACRDLNIKCLVTERRCIENYLTQSAIDRAFPGKGFAALGPFDDSKSAPWGKENSWRIAPHMTPEEIRATDVGRFLDDLLKTASAQQ